MAWWILSNAARIVSLCSGSLVFLLAAARSTSNSIAGIPLSRSQVRLCCSSEDCQTTKCCSVLQPCLRRRRARHFRDLCGHMGGRVDSDELVSLALLPGLLRQGHSQASLEERVGCQRQRGTVHDPPRREHWRAFFRSHASWIAARGSEYRVDPPITVLAHPGHAQSATWKSTFRLVATYGLVQDLRLDLRVRPLQ